MPQLSARSIDRNKTPGLSFIDARTLILEPALFLAHRAAEMGKWIDHSKFDGASGTAIAAQADRDQGGQPISQTAGEPVRFRAT